MFEGNAQAGINFYIALFLGSQINEAVRDTAGELEPQLRSTTIIASAESLVEATTASTFPGNSI
jgi:hypothetical protein